MRRKLAAGFTALTVSTLNVTAGSGNHHMMDSPMWGWHWSGTLFMLAVWILIILAIIFLAQKIVQNGGEN